MKQIRHLAIIPDGNRRWARAQGLPTLEGHRRGYDNFKTIGDACLSRGIEQLTFWGFSTENWKRSQEEVGYLMDLILGAVTRDVDFYHEKHIRLRIIGRREELSQSLQDAIAAAEAKTASNTRGQVNLCVNYGGRAEMLDATKHLLASGVQPQDLTEELFETHLMMAGIPDIDLIVRTSGEQRLSGFQPWKGGYAELYFAEKHWPEFSVEDLDAAIAEFENRERRFGK
jgi:undecaprenyl diphosphate synthase